ncbi:TIM barrel protein [Anatilimnocola floriformis]|uniref:TIM barrel protein n=1 Tax=Anatilimnocola floriformis TaxID=2948575 RepID=UPI0020C4E66B|nr:TIM barrel protein [Anatilimnocola floriformis]
MNRAPVSRRDLLKWTAAGAVAATLPGLLRAEDKKEPLFKISLAEWSLNKSLFGRTDWKITNMDFARVAKEEFGIEAVEYVNQFFKDKAKDTAYLGELKKRSDDLGVKTLLIMCDGEGALGDADEKKRTQAVENHYKWVEAVKYLGGHSIRVNAQSSGTYEEQIDRAADGLRKLSEFGDTHGINVIVENHGGNSSDGEWLSKVMKKVDHKRCGTLPDFGNFNIGNGKVYDRYKGVDELMPFAKAVSAKSHDFDADGNETKTDYKKIMEIVVKKHNYHGYCGIEYEGSRLPEKEGIMATKKLLEKVRDELAKA